MEPGVEHEITVGPRRGRRRGWWKRPAVALSLLPLPAGAMGGGPAAAQGVFAGACVVTIQVDFSPTLDPVATGASLSLDGSGTCTMEDGNDYPATIEGDLGFPAYTCAGGVAVGTVRISVVGHQDFSSAVADAVVVHTVEVATLALLDTVELEAAAVGAFLQDPSDIVPCLTSGLDGTTWWGALVFEDPKLS